MSQKVRLLLVTIMLLVTTVQFAVAMEDAFSYGRGTVGPGCLTSGSCFSSEWWGCVADDCWTNYNGASPETEDCTYGAEDYCL